MDLDKEMADEKDDIVNPNEFLKSKEGKKTMKLYHKNLKIVMKRFKVNKKTAERYISKASEYSIKNTRDMINIIRRYIYKPIDSYKK